MKQKHASECEGCLFGAFPVTCEFFYIHVEMGEDFYDKHERVSVGRVDLFREACEVLQAASI